jgi:hypothetical protein
MKQKTDTASDDAACSASSDTPETDGKCLTWYPGTCTLGHDGESIDGRVVLADFARKLERQRNAAWQTLKEIRELFTADESFGATVEALFATPLEEAEAEIARLQSLLND